MTVIRPSEFTTLLEGYFPTTVKIPDVTDETPPVQMLDYMPWADHDEIWQSFLKKYDISPLVDMNGFVNVNGTLTVGYGKTALVRTLFDDYVATFCSKSYLNQDSSWTTFRTDTAFWNNYKDANDVTLNSIPANSELLDTVVEIATGNTFYIQDLFRKYIKQQSFGVSSNPIWQAFSALYGITPTTNLDGEISLGNQVPVKTLFSQYVQELYVEQQKVSQLSDNEIKGRRIIYTVMDILLLLIKASQENAAVIQNTILYLAKKQREYNDQIASIAFYRGESDIYGKPARNDLSDWTLGYANITMEDYILSAIVPRAADVDEFEPPPNDEVPTVPVGYQQLFLNAVPRDDFIESIFGSTLQIPITLNVSSIFGLDSPIVSNQIVQSYRLEFTGSDEDFKIEFFIKMPQYVYQGGVNFDEQFVETSIVKTVDFDENESTASRFEKAQALFNELLNTTTFQTTTSGTAVTYTLVANDGFGGTLGDYIADPRIPFHTEWDNQLNRPLDDQHGGTKATTRGGVARAARNQLLNQYLENARTRREVVADFQDTMETTFDASKQGITRSSDLINSAIKQLINILTSIFRVV